MDAEAIISNCHSIYERFQVPFNLRTHMLRVGALTRFLCDNWRGEEINKKNCIATCLIHDLANLIKFDMKRNTSFLQKKDSFKDIELRQKRMILKYGNDEHEATLKMAKEINVSREIIFILKNMEFKYSKKILESENYEIKLCGYSDWRVSPFKVLTLNERLEEFRKRYTETEEPYPGFNELVLNCERVELQLKPFFKINIDIIPENIINSYMEEFN